MKQAIAQAFLKINGWKLEGELPADPRIVMIAAPHTSNWDLPLLLAMGWAVGYDTSWMGKHQIFRAPFGGVARWLGGIPVRRDRRNDLVAQMAKVFAESERLVLTVPPEGTRTKTEYWKSGFYRIALAAGVPIHLGYLHYPTKRGGFGPVLHPTGDPKKDMDVIRAFYADKVGRHADRFGVPRLREED